MDVESVKSVFNTIFSNPHPKAIIAILVTFLEWSLGRHYEVLAGIYLLVLIDTITGLWLACRQRTVSSKGFFRFSAKLIVYFFMLITSAMVDKSIPLGFAVPIMASFLSMTEAISILENIGKLGFPVPTKLLLMLKDYNTKDEK